MDFGLNGRWSTRGPKSRPMPQNTAGAQINIAGSGSSFGSGSPSILTRNRPRKSFQLHSDVQTAPQIRKRGWDNVDSHRSNSMCSHEVAEETSPTRPFLNFAPHPIVSHPSSNSGRVPQGGPGGAASATAARIGGTGTGTGAGTGGAGHYGSSHSLGNPSGQGQGQGTREGGNVGGMGVLGECDTASGSLGAMSGSHGAHSIQSGGQQAQQFFGVGSTQQDAHMRSSMERGESNSVLGTPLLPPATPDRCQLTPQIQSRETRKDRHMMSVCSGTSYEHGRHSMSGSLDRQNGMIPWAPLGSQGKMEVFPLPRIDNAMLTTTLVTPHSPHLSIGGGTEGSKSPCGGPLTNANWEGCNFQHYRHFGSGSLGSATSIGGPSPLVQSTTFGSQGSPSASASASQGLFGNIGKLDFGAALRNVNGPCTCCRGSNKMDMVDVNTVKIPYITVRRAYNQAHANFPLELWEAFGEDVLEKIFEEGVKPCDVRCLANAGLNHEFIAIAKKQLFKLIVPKSPNTAGEAHEMEFLRKNYPDIAKDRTVCFPRKCFRLITGSNPPVYDVVVLDYHEGAMSVREITAVYERAGKEDKARMYNDMHSLVGEQAPRVLRRYQITHMRKHGDAKADNILVTRDGLIVMCDMGSTFNDSLKPCDREEYMRSIQTLDPHLQEMKRRFEETFRNGDHAEQTETERKKNAALLKTVRGLPRTGGGTPPMGGGLLGAGMGAAAGGFLGTGCTTNGISHNPNPNIGINPGMGAGLQGGLLGGQFARPHLHSNQPSPTGGPFMHTQLGGPEIRLGNPGGVLNANLAAQNLLGATPVINAPNIQAGNLLTAFNTQNSPQR